MKSGVSQTIRYYIKTTFTLLANNEFGYKVMKRLFEKHTNLN